MAGQAAVDGRRVRVVDAVVGRADQRAAVDLPREPRQVLAELDAGHARGDRLELAADLGGASGFMSHMSRWLGPPSRKMRMQASAVGESAGWSGGCSGGQTIPCALPAPVVGAEQPGKAQAEEEASAQLQHLAPSDWLRASAGEWPGDRQAMPQFEKSLAEHACNG